MQTEAFWMSKSKKAESERKDMIKTYKIRTREWLKW
jgi:hypothetical protein